MSEETKEILKDVGTLFKTTEAFDAGEEDPDRRAALPSNRRRQ